MNLLQDNEISRRRGTFFDNRKLKNNLHFKKIDQFSHLLRYHSDNFKKKRYSFKALSIVLIFFSKTFKYIQDIFVTPLHAFKWQNKVFFMKV